MKLALLDPHFLRYASSRIDTWQVIDGDPATWNERGRPTKSVTGPREHRTYVDSLAEAQGLMFLCPKCFHTNGGNVGTHYCEVTFAGRGAPDDLGSHNKDGRPTRWNVSGSGLDDLTTTPSILLEGGCAWHGYITNGDAA